LTVYIQLHSVLKAVRAFVWWTGCKFSGIIVQFIGNSNIFSFVLTNGCSQL